MVTGDGTDGNVGTEADTAHTSPQNGSVISFVNTALRYISAI